MTQGGVATDVQVVARAPIHPTEVPDRVQEAVLRFWPDATASRLEADGSTDTAEVVATASSLDALRSAIWDSSIIDAFRSGIQAEGQELHFRISKQAALAGLVAVPPTPHVLGDIQVTATLDPDDPWPDAEHLKWWLCPQTEEGKIIGQTDAPGSVPTQV